MRRFFKTAGLVVLAALALTLLLTAAGWLLGRDNPLTRGFQTLAAPAEKLVNRGVTALEGVYGYLHDFDLLKAENAALKRRIAEMEESVRQSEGERAENQRLRTLLGLYQEHTDFELVDAEIISWGASNWSSVFSIDRGTQSGLSAGDCVITESGFVVGLVTEAGLYSATVRTLIDPQTAIGAKLPSGLSAVAEGDFTLMAGGRLKLTYVFEGAALNLGDTVLTSGAGGVYPSGLVIGELTDTLADESGFAAYGVVTPSASLESLSQVFVIRGFTREAADAQ